jgi:hypothetical protein
MHESPYFYIDENGKKRRKPAESFRRWVIVICSTLFCATLIGFYLLIAYSFSHIRISPRSQPAQNQSNDEPTPVAAPPQSQ